MMMIYHYNDHRKDNYLNDIESILIHDNDKDGKNK